MGTATIPFSNPAGNNQTSPGSGAKSVASPMSTGAIPASPASDPAANPYVATAPAATATVATPAVLNAGSTSANNPNTQAQLTDIYGKGVGTDLSNLLGSIGGTNSATLQEFQQSMAPQEATAAANLHATLGAEGVSANSSTSAIGEANLQAQNTAAMAGETAQLTQSGQQLEANILGGTENAAQQEVAASGWDVFGQVLNAGAQDAGGIMKGLGSMGVQL